MDPTTPSTLYAGNSGGGVFLTTDSGGSWSAINTGLSDYALDVHALAIEPTTPSTLTPGPMSARFPFNWALRAPAIAMATGPSRSMRPSRS